MPFVPAPNILQVEYIFATSVGRAENIMYFRKQDLSAFSSLEVTALLTALAEWWLEAGAPLTTSEVRLVELFGTDLTTALAPTFSFAVGEDGTSTSGEMPANVTITMSFRSNGRGRSSRGRNYWVGIPGGAVSGNDVNQTWLDDNQEYYDHIPNLVDGLDTSWEPVIVSRFTGGEPREVALVHLITAYIHADVELDSQRRRLRNRGS